MAHPDGEEDAPLLDRWLADQQQWQRTMLSYLDSLAKSDDFLVHLGNAMRGSLLAGKPNPAAAPAGTEAPEDRADDRLDRILFALNQLQGQVQDLAMTLDELRGRLPGKPATPAAAPRKAGRKRGPAARAPKGSRKVKA